MAQPTLSGATVLLTDYLSYGSWVQQLKLRCAPLRIWKRVNPDTTDESSVEPIEPELPRVENYPPLANLANGNADFVPTHPSELSANGLRAFKEDVEYYKIQLDSFKQAERRYIEERKNIEKIASFIQSTVSVHLQNNCLLPDQTPRDWVRSLRDTVGVDADDERDRARTRYLQALKPMRQPGSWETWLTEYDHAATEAEAKGVGEVQNLQDIMKDFVLSVAKAAPSWWAPFQETGRRDPNMNRKEMMKRFREHMVILHPRGKSSQRGAFGAGEPTPAACGASTPDSDRRDASQSENGAPSSLNCHGQNRSQGRGRPRNKRQAGSRAKSRQSAMDTAAAGGSYCPVCDLPHELKDCYYAFPENAPEWFRHNPGYLALAKYKMDHDSDLQGQIRGLKRSRPQGSTKPRSSAGDTESL